MLSENSLMLECERKRERKKVSSGSILAAVDPLVFRFFVLCHVTRCRKFNVIEAILSCPCNNNYSLSVN